MKVNEAEAIAIVKGITSKQIAQIKRENGPDFRKFGPGYADEVARADGAVTKALLEAAGVDENADAAKIVDEAWASAPRDANGDVDERVAVRLTVATNLLK